MNADLVTADLTVDERGALSTKIRDVIYNAHREGISVDVAARDVSIVQAVEAIIAGRLGQQAQQVIQAIRDEINARNGTNARLVLTGAIDIVQRQTGASAPLRMVRAAVR